MEDLTQDIGILGKRWPIAYPGISTLVKFQMV